MPLSASVANLPAPGRAPRRLRRQALTMLAVTASVAGLVAVARPARADAAGSLVSAANQARASAGLPALTTSGDLAAVASRQAAAMARSNVLSHTPGLASAVCCWVNLGENVGYGASAAGVHAAFMASAAHRANLLSHAYTQIGVGYAVDGRGILWVSEIFRRPKGAVPAPTAPVVRLKPAPVAAAAALPPRTPVVVHAARPPVIAAPPPAALAVPRSASRAVTRAPIDVARRFASQFDSGPVSGTNPVSRLLDFAAKAAWAN